MLLLLYCVNYNLSTPLFLTKWSSPEGGAVDHQLLLAQHACLINKEKEKEIAGGFTVGWLYVLGTVYLA